MLITILKTAAIAAATVVGLTGAVTETNHYLSRNEVSTQHNEPAYDVTVGWLEGDIPDLLITANRFSDPALTAEMTSNRRPTIQ
jgi:hypothetical protein